MKAATPRSLRHSGVNAFFLTPKRRLLLIALLALIWGSEWIANQHLRDTPTLLVLALRCLIGSAALIPWAVRGRPGLAVGKNCLLGCAIIAAPAILSSNSRDLSPGLTVLLYAMTPLISTLLENQAGIAGAPWLLGGMTGVAFLVRGSLSFSPAQGWGIASVALAVFSLAAGMVTARKWLPGQNLAAALAIQLLSASVTIGAFSLLHDRDIGIWTAGSFLLTVLLGLAGSSISYFILYRLLCYYRASQITVVQWIIPVVGVSEVAIWLRHLPDWDTWAGALLAAVCAFLMLRMRPSEEEGKDDDRLSVNG